MTERVLVIMNTIDAGGAESFVMKIFRCVHGKFIFDFLINKSGSDFYLAEIERLGGRVFCGISKSQNLFASFRFIYKMVKQGKYKKIFCVAVHPLGFLDIWAAKLGGARLCIVRSTNSKAGGLASQILAILCRPFLRVSADAMLAPSKEAGIWLFGRSAVEQDRVKMIANGLQIGLYKYDEEKRIRKRKELGLQENEFVVGHIGRFNKQKNHGKLIDIFAKLHQRMKNAKLILVGDGELRKEIESKVNTIGLANTVHFLGIRNDVPEILMAMDVFVFPSLYEGMPNAVIEAQATGLTCIISDTVSREVKITDCLVQVGLNQDNEIWVEKILQTHNDKRHLSIEEIIKNGYSIEKPAGMIQQMLMDKEIS